MKESIRRRARQAVCDVIALVFLALCIGSLVAPDKMADGLGYVLDNANAKSEFRAIYVGLWAMHAVIFVLAGRRPDERDLQLVCVLLLSGQVLGRVVSLVLDGVPGPSILVPFAAEAAAAAVLTALLPEAAADE